MRYLPLAAALLLAGCIDFKEITEPPPEPPPPPSRLPAEFHASLVLDEAGRGDPGGSPAAGGVRVHASLTPGRGPDGWPAPVGDDTLRVSGVALTPTSVAPDGTLVYEGWAPLPGPGEEGVLLAVSPPRAARREDWPAVLHQPIPRRLGEDTLRVAAGAELRLPFSLPEPPPEARVPERGWYLEVSGARGQLSVSGSGAPPSPLVVPLGLLAPGPGETLGARLHLSSRTALGERGDGGNFVEIVMSASLAWAVRRAEDDPAG